MKKQRKKIVAFVMSIAVLVCLIPSVQAAASALPDTRLHVWFSLDPMGNQANNIRLRDTVYLCYRLETADGKLLDSSIGNYKVKETIYFPDGSTVPHTYEKSNNNWIRSSFGQWGTYRGVVEVSGDYKGKVEVSYTIAKPKQVLFHAWFSASKMGGEASELEKGKPYYLCYSINYGDSGYLNQYVNMNYTVTQAVYGPDGKKVYEGTYNNSDNNWISFTPTQSGNYKGIITIKGDLNVSNEVVRLCKDTTVVKQSELQSISITKQPQKLSYTVGEQLNTSGMVVTAKYSDGKTKTVSDYKVSGTTNAAGQSKVTVSYTENGITKTAFYTITVQEKELPKETVTITYDPKGGTLSQKTQSGIKNSYVTLLKEQPCKSIKITFDANGASRTPGPMFLQQKFEGWVYDTGSGKACYSAGSRFLLNGNCTLTAAYKDAVLDALPDVQRTGYRFDGWMMTGNVRAYIGMSIYSDMKLNARWVKEESNDKIDLENPDASDNTKPGEPDYIDNLFPEEPNVEESILPEEPDLDDWADSGDSDNMDDGRDNYEWDDGDGSADADESIGIGDEIIVDDVIYTVTKLKGTPCVEYTESIKDKTANVVIPAKIRLDGVTYRVTSVAAKAFYKNTSVKKLSIGKYVTKIGSKAFYGCKSLKKIVISSKKIKNGGIGSQAFTKIAKKAKVYVPKAKYKSYKKLLKRAGVGSKAKICKK